MTEDNAGAAELRGKLIKRLAVAGGLVAVLLGVLAFFDRLVSAPDEPEAPVYSQPVPVPPKKELTQPVKGTEPAAPEKTEPAAPAPPPLEAPAKPEVAARPDLPAPAPTSSAPAVRHAPVEPAAPPPVPEGTGNPTPASPPAAPQASHSSPAPAGSPAPRTPQAAPGYVLQAGVFASAQRAEELHAKLSLAGIPSTLEARVQVGPFKTRQEAEAARAKLKGLGIEPILIPPSGRR